MFKENLANLIKVKTIITLFITAVFCYMSIFGVIAPELFMTVFSMIITFYFSSQQEKKKQQEESAATTE